MSIPEQPAEMPESLPDHPPRRNRRRPHPPKPLSERQRSALLRNIAKAREVGRTLPRSPAQRAASLRAIQLAHESNRGRPLKLTPQHLAALRRNAAKATAARARRERTPEHLAKLRETIKLARAARTRGSYDLHNAKILRHGMYARSVRATMRALGDNPARLDQRIRLLKRFFASSDPREEALIRALAKMLWRRERLCYAQADWECRRLDAVFMAAEAAPAGHTFSDDEMTMRAYNLLEALMDVDKFDSREWHMEGSVKRLLRRLLRLRFGREPDFHP